MIGDRQEPLSIDNKVFLPSAGRMRPGNRWGNGHHALADL
jgi:hypothetical protein